MTRSVEIPDAAVEAAAQVFFDLAHPEANVSGLTLASFPGSVDRYHRYTRAALVAARPYLMPLLDREAVCEKIADWYSAHYNPDHDFFYETDNRGVSGDEDENATHAYRGFKLTLELARPMPTQFEVAARLHGEKHGDGCTFTNPANCDRWHESLREANAVLALLNGES